MGQEIEDKPIILEAPSPQALDDLRRGHKIWKEFDLHSQQLRDWYEITHPDKRLEADFDAAQQKFVAENSSLQAGTWVYFPWSGELVHMIGAEEYFKLRTNRNRNLIEPGEQQKMFDYSVAVAGMSVGGGIAVGLAYSGISNYMRLADFDTLQTPNLNRVRAKISSLGRPKLKVVAEQIYEINPFAAIEAFTTGINHKNLESFVSSPIRAVFDEIDDFKMKIRLRLAAQKAGVAVLMLTSLGDSVLIDVERYDLDPKTQLFNGLLGGLPDEILNNPIGEREKIKYAMQIVGAENIPLRALTSLREINRTLVGRPQLYSTIAIDGGLGAYLVKRLALGIELPSGRMRVSLDEIIGVAGIGEDAANKAALLAEMKGLTG